jgi:hypothetical protein
MNTLRTIALGTLTVVASLAGARSASAAWSTEVLWVANNGVDSGSCGAQASPCRSISQAITNAPVGAFIRVGPGRYGDLNRNGAYDAGDEGPRTPGRVALVRIDKPVRISSTHGAELTTIDFGPDGSKPAAVVSIDTSGVYFGDVGKGFTLVGNDTAGIRMQGPPRRRNVRIVGNIVSGFRGVGVYVYTGGEAITISDNVFARNLSWGLHVNLHHLSGETGLLLIERNTIRENANAFSLTASNVRFVGNVIDGNHAQGGAVWGGSGILMHRNFFIGNGGQAALLVSQRASGSAPPLLDRFVLNTVVGNAGVGVQTFGKAIGRFESNNIYGNAVGGNVGAPGLPNCGLWVTGGYPGGDMVAANNFWGTATGPGPDPADDAGPGSGCDLEGAQTVVTPFATAAFPNYVTTDD